MLRSTAKIARVSTWTPKTLRISAVTRAFSSGLDKKITDQEIQHLQNEDLWSQEIADVGKELFDFDGEEEDLIPTAMEYLKEHREEEAAVAELQAKEEAAMEAEKAQQLVAGQESEQEVYGDIQEMQRKSEGESEPAFPFFGEANWGIKERVDKSSKRINKVDKFPPKYQRMHMETSVSETTFSEADMESPYLMGKRLHERQEKPMVVEVERDVSDLHPFRGTRYSIYQRDKAKTQKQLSYMRMYYKQEYEEAQRKKAARLTREWDAIQKLKTEKLTQKRIRAHYNLIAHEKRAAELREIGRLKRAAAYTRWQRWQKLQAKERIYQIEFLREEREKHWMITPEHVTEDLFDDSTILVPQGSMPLGGSGVQSNFTPNFRFLNYKSRD